MKEAQQAPKKQKRILVIDDDLQLLKMIRKTLDQYGYSVIIAQDGEEGIQKYHQELPELVITDIFMEKKEGIETIDALKKKFRDIKIIAMSGGAFYDSELYLKIAKDMGAIRTLKKPFPRDELLKVIIDVIGEPRIIF